jgi:hypothetical protein
MLFHRRICSISALVTTQHKRASGSVCTRRNKAKLLHGVAREGKQRRHVLQVTKKGKEDNAIKDGKQVFWIERK